MVTQTDNVNAADSVLATLQPIRDLAQNWDIDIASCLEEYLQDLNAIRLGVGHVGGGAGAGGPNQPSSSSTDGPNFAQAALVLQNSTHIYSRKVEFLYSLVYKTLDEFFRETSTGKESQSSRRKSADASIDEFHAFDPHVEFLLLDDVVPIEVEAHNKKTSKIDLPQQLQHDDTSNLDFSGGRISDVRTPGLNGTRLSLGGLSVTKMDRTTASRYSTGGSSAGASSSEQRALLGVLNSGCLRLVDGRCDVGDDGVLLMPGSSTGPASCPAHAISALAGSVKRHPVPPRQDRVEVVGNDPQSDTVQPMELDYNMGGGDYDDDHDNDGDGFIFAGGDDNDYGQEENVHDDVGTATQAAGSRAGGHRVTFQDQAPPGGRKVNEKPDPWKMLDPHTVDPGDYKNNKPLKKGKTYRLPAGIDEPPSSCVTGASTRRTSRRSQAETVHSRAKGDKYPTSSLAVEIFRATLHKRSRRDSTTPTSRRESSSSHDFFTDINDRWLTKAGLTGLAFGKEFEYVAKETSKRRAAERRAIRKQQIEQSAENAGQNPTAFDGQDGGYDDDDYDDYGGGFAFGGDDDIDDYRDGVNDGGNNAGIASLDDAFANANGDEDDGESNLGPKTFEELCRAHIEAFAKGAQEYALSSQLTDRVNQWQERLAPILEEEERRAEFDIHAYASRVIQLAQEELIRKEDVDTTSKSSSQVGFDVVTRRCSQYEVCRLFLASLSLANSGNVKIVEQQSTTNEFQFHLMSSDVERPMETYQAPSLHGEAN